MGFTNCPESGKRQICILYTDTLHNNRSALFTVNIENDETSAVNISKQLDMCCINDENKNEKYGGHHSEFVKICKQADNSYVNKEVSKSSDEGRKYSMTEWVVFASVCIVMIINVSVVHAFGTLFPHMLSEFGGSRASTATVQSVLFGVGLCSGLVAGSIVQQFGPRISGVLGSTLFSLGFVSSFFAASTVYLVLSCGIISGLGFSYLTISANQAASQCFEGTSRIIGLSVVSSASGVGAMLYPYLLSWMADVFGVSGTLLVLGGITMNGIPMALLWKPLDKQSKTEMQKPNSDKTSSLNQLYARVFETIKHKPFCAVLLGFGLAMPSITMFEILAMDILESYGMFRSQSVMLFIVLNAVSIPGRLVPGLIKRIHGASCLTGPIIGTIISGIGMLMMNLSDSLAGSGAACAALGVSKGILLGSMQIIVLEMLDTVKFSIGLGIMFGLIGALTTSLGPLNGLLRDISGSYRASLYGASVTMVFALLLFCISAFLNNKTKIKKLHIETVSIFNVTHF